MPLNHRQVVEQYNRRDSFGALHLVMICNVSKRVQLLHFTDKFHRRVVVPNSCAQKGERVNRFQCCEVAY